MTPSGCATDMSLAASSLEALSLEASTDDACDSGMAPASGQASKPRRGVLLSFALTVTIGLMLATWYLGVRIVAADEVAAINSTPRGPVASAPVRPSDPHRDPKVERYWDALPISPFYLQAAGIGPKQDANFARSLRAKGFLAQVQAGEGGTTRIVIGPFSTHAQMDQMQRKLQSAGVLAVETGH